MPAQEIEVAHDADVVGHRRRRSGLSERAALRTIGRELERPETTRVGVDEEIDPLQDLRRAFDRGHQQLLDLEATDDQAAKACLALGDGRRRVAAGINRYIDE
jgi:hypothetical protein